MIWPSGWERGVDTVRHEGEALWVECEDCWNDSNPQESVFSVPDNEILAINGWNAPVGLHLLNVWEKSRFCANLKPVLIGINNRVS